MTFISSKYVPSDGPSDAKIAFVGEAPGPDEEDEKKPFVGRAGDKLITCLGRNGLHRSSVFLTNLSKHRPEHNNFTYLLNSSELTNGLRELTEELTTLKPNVIVPLGNWPLWFLTKKCGKEKGKDKQGSGITNWRGSILTCTLPGLEDVKCIPTFHPSFVARNAINYPTFDNDLARVVQDSTFPELRLPKRKYIIADSKDQVEFWTEELVKSNNPISFDIETFGYRLACCGFAPSKDLGVCFPYTGDSFVLECIRRILESDIPKIPHFGFFDVNYLKRFYNIETKNWWWDTYVCQRVIDPELPKTLAYITSINTREPFYKYEGKADGDIKSWAAKMDKTQLYTYNCKDVCVTLESQSVQEEELKTGPHQWKDTFSFDMDCTRESALHISRTGMLVDTKRKLVIQNALLLEWVKHQKMLNTLVGQPMGPKVINVPGTDVPQLLNVDSDRQVPFCLYDYLGFKKRRKRDGKVTADEHAVVALIGIAKKEYDSKVTDKGKMPWLRRLLVCKEILIIRGLRKKKSSYTDWDVGEGGRARSLYKLGPDTGRWSAEKWIDGSGFNMQTCPRDGVEIL